MNEKIGNGIWTSCKVKRIWVKKEELKLNIVKDKYKKNRNKTIVNFI